MVDLETTGLRPGQSGICEIGAVRLRGFEVEAEFETLVDPGQPIAAGASAVTGLRNEHLRGAPRPAEAVRSFLAFAGDAVLVAHNAGFDMGVITAACMASEIETPSYDYLCSLQLARKTYHLDSYKLPVAAMAAGFEDFTHHDALEDAAACAAISTRSSSPRCARSRRCATAPPRRSPTTCAATSRGSPCARDRARSPTARRGSRGGTAAA